MRTIVPRCKCHVRVANLSPTMILPYGRVSGSKCLDESMDRNAPTKSSTEPRVVEDHASVDTRRRTLSPGPQVVELLDDKLWKRQLRVTDPDLHQNLEIGIWRTLIHHFVSRTLTDPVDIHSYCGLSTLSAATEFIKSFKLSSLRYSLFEICKSFSKKWRSRRRRCCKSLPKGLKMSRTSADRQASLSLCLCTKFHIARLSMNRIEVRKCSRICIVVCIPVASSCLANAG